MLHIKCYTFHNFDISQFWPNFKKMVDPLNLLTTPVPHQPLSSSTGWPMQWYRVFQYIIILITQESTRCALVCALIPSSLFGPVLLRFTCCEQVQVCISRSTRLNIAAQRGKSKLEETQTSKVSLSRLIFYGSVVYTVQCTVWNV